MEVQERWREILDFERSWWTRRVRKEAAARERFGLSPARYHQLLDRAIDSEDALRYDPMLVRRLRRLRDERRRKRFAAGATWNRSTEPVGLGRQA